MQNRLLQQAVFDTRSIEPRLQPGDAMNNPGGDLLSQGGKPPSTIGAGGLSFRIRNGNGRFPAAMTTGKIEIFAIISA